MISLRGLAMSVAVHGLAAALVSAHAIFPANAPEEDVAAIPVELVFEMESAPVLPAEPVEEVVAAYAIKAPAQDVVEPEPELATKREMPVQIPPIVEVKPREAKVQKPEPKALKSSQKKQVAALAAGKGSLGKLRSTDGKAVEQNYNSKVLARLRAAKTYPAAARGKGIEGTAILTFTITSSGKLASARVVKGAGHALLDSAVIAMARKAAPFPAFPQAISKSQMTFRVPVQFKIN